MKRENGIFTYILVEIFIFPGMILFAGCDEEIGLSQGSSSSGTYTDMRDLRTYKTVTINDQTWMAENLAYIPYVSDGKTQSGIWVYDYEEYDVDSARLTGNYRTYGCLYDWETANTICPAGWHLPGDEEWRELSGYIREKGYNYSVGTALKSSDGWIPETGNNAFGFNALAAGSRGLDGSFYYMGGMTTYWSSMQTNEAYAWAHRLDHTSKSMFRHSGNKLTGYSVRCIKDRDDMDGIEPGSDSR